MTAFSRPAWPLLTAALISLSLAGCAAKDEPMVMYPRVNYDYLTKLELNVASIDIDDSKQPNADNRDISLLAPITPTMALRQMAKDRLVPTGATGHAAFVVDSAKILRVRDHYEGSMTVHLEITNADGTSSGYAGASVSRSNSFEKDSPNAVRADLNTLVTQMMSDMNAEFEFQVRRSLHSYLQSQSKTAPQPSAVSAEPLSKPAVPQLVPVSPE